MPPTPVLPTPLPLATPPQAVVGFKASGSIEDYPEERRAQLLADVASLAGLDTTEGSTITVAAGSVVIQIHLQLRDDAQWTSVSAALSTSFASAEAASAALSIEVTSTPQIAQIVEVAPDEQTPDGDGPIIDIDSGSSALSSATGGGGEAGSSTAAVAACAVTATILAIVACLAVYRYRRSCAKIQLSKLWSRKQWIARTNPVATPMSSMHTMDTAPLSLPPLIHEGFQTRTISSASPDPSNPFSGPTSGVAYTEYYSPGGSKALGARSGTRPAHDDEATTADAAAFQMQI